MSRCPLFFSLLVWAAGVAPVLIPARAVAEGTEEELLLDVTSAFTSIEAWRTDEARVIAERWLERKPEHALTLALVAQVKNYLSDYAGAVEYYARAELAGAPPALLRDAPLAKAAREATRGYAETTSKHFIFRYEPGKDSILVPFAEETLEAAMERIGDLLGWRPTSRVVVEFYPSAATLAQVSTLTRQDIEASGTIALCKWNRLMVTSPRAVLLGYSWRDTLAHELTHLIIGGASKNTVPIWLHEGIAKYAETAWRDRPGLGLSVEQQERLQTAARQEKLISFDRMHPSMAKLKSQEETSLAFAEVFTFIEFLVEQKGWAGIREVLLRLSEGASEDEAVAAVFGAPILSLSQTWMKSLKARKIQRDGVALSREREVVVKDRPDAPDDSLHGLSKAGRRFARAADLLYARGRLKAAQEELEKAYAETSSPILSGRLAKVALAAGDLDAAERASQIAIRATPDLPGPHLTLAEVLIRRQRPAEAAAPLGAAISINPFDPRIHQMRLIVLGPDGDAEAKKHATHAIALLSGLAPTQAPLAGSGGRIEVKKTPFSRVIIDREGESLATGMITPTLPFALRPGTVRLRLIPPSGPETVRSIVVLDRGEADPPQRIEPETEGS